MNIGRDARERLRAEVTRRRPQAGPVINLRAIAPDEKIIIRRVAAQRLHVFEVRRRYGVGQLSGRGSRHPLFAVEAFVKPLGRPFAFRSSRKVQRECESAAVKSGERKDEADQNKTQHQPSHSCAHARSVEPGDDLYKAAPAEQAERGHDLKEVMPEEPPPDGEAAVRCREPDQ